MSWAAVAGVAGSVIGGMLDKETGEPAQAQTQQQATMTPEQYALLNKIIGELMGQSSLIGNEAYTGPMSADLSKLEETSLAGLQERAMQLSTGGTPEDQAIKKALMDMLTGPEIATDDFVKKNVEDPALRLFREEFLPDITRRFSGSALFGSDRKEAEARGSRDIQTAVSEKSSDIRYSSAKDKQNRILQALGMAPGIMAAPTAELLSTLEAGSVPRSVQQNKLTADYQEWLRQRNTTNQSALAALGLKPFENITTATAASPGIFGGSGGTLGYYAGSQIAKLLNKP